MALMAGSGGVTSVPPDPYMAREDAREIVENLLARVQDAP
jgi:hypothetical protein